MCFIESSKLNFNIEFFFYFKMQFFKIEKKLTMYALRSPVSFSDKIPAVKCVSNFLYWLSWYWIWNQYLWMHFPFSLFGLLLLYNDDNIRPLNNTSYILDNGNTQKTYPIDRKKTDEIIKKQNLPMNYHYYSVLTW